ncbi:DUF4352 domain-containing protein [Paucisalibacillus globulus]|uniref:DUF4352 domain-containing protein n=1 Tax=Paucisalibacillus globulus TaxID=351095 RepID=UPI00042A61D8|nr:DUF4352 domain-containing protein [Paucisalibacillus globulus]
MIRNKLLFTFVILLAMSLFLVGCSDVESTNPSDKQLKTDENFVKNNNASLDNSDFSSNNANKQDSDGNKEEKKKDEHIEHQYGLKIGETGTVVSYFSNNLDDRIRYEVTLNEVRYDENLDLRLFEDAFVVVDITIKNIDDQSFKLTDIFTPNFGDLESTVYFVPVKSEFVQDFSGITILEGELQPGETKTGNYVFDVPNADNYKFAFGKTSDQIVTLAEWELSAEEIK